MRAPAATLMTMLLLSRVVSAAATGDVPSPPPGPAPNVTSADVQTSDTKPLTREDLDADVNGYLDFEIPPRDGKPVTLRNIMTHTPGFEERIKDLIVPEGTPFAPLDEYLKEWVPARIFAPGTTPAYSNYATALAGYIVARVSGLSFDEYVEQHILTPLGMQHSTFRQPLPDRLREFMANGYARASDGKAKPFEVVVAPPAGSQAASGADMARFMTAHLQKGAFGEARILKAETAEQMHTTTLTVLTRVDRMVLGFYEQQRNGRRIIACAVLAEQAGAGQPTCV